MAEEKPKHITLTDVYSHSKLQISIYKDTILVFMESNLHDCVTGHPVVEISKQDLINLIEQCK